MTMHNDMAARVAGESSGALGAPVGPADRLTPPAPPTGTDQTSDAGVRAASDMRMNGCGGCSRRTTPT